MFNIDCLAQSKLINKSNLKYDKLRYDFLRKEGFFKSPFINKKRLKADNISDYDSFQLSKSKNYTQIGPNVDVGQGCIYAGSDSQVIKSSGFDSCSPFIAISPSSGKRVYGHIDSQSKPGEIVKKIVETFSPSEVRNASYHYFRGAETLSPGQGFGRFAIKTIEDALEKLSVKGIFHGALKTGEEDVVLKKNLIQIFDSGTVKSEIKV